MSRYNGEQVLVVPRSAFEQVGAFNGVRLNAQEYLAAFFSNGVAHYMDRDAAEQNPAFKQIIAYAIFCHNGKVLAYARTAKGGETRLHDKWSLGIGGHINPIDGLADNPDTYLAGVEREIREEIAFSGTASQQIYAIINDDTNEVGSVHLASYTASSWIATKCARWKKSSPTSSSVHSMNWPAPSTTSSKPGPPFV